ncbi:MAG: calcineurin-like phosphoesterase C-terminal domain-containing protein [Fimbriimonadaceae bacterium]
MITMQKKIQLGTKFFLFIALAMLLAVSTFAQTATGFVFDDQNRNGVMDSGERGIPGVMVSNMRDIVRTDSRGRYSIDAGDDSVIFVIKPRNWAFPLDEDNYPKFYYVHKPKGSPPLKQGGVPPTGPLPPRIDFPLYRSSEPNRFDVLVFGDTQPSNDDQLDFTVQDAISEVVGIDAAFGITMGDIISGGNLQLLPPIKSAKGRVGIPWLYVQGNHDKDFDAPDDSLASETWQRIFGPQYYAYQYGPVLFVILENVNWTGEGYTSALGANQLQFLDNLLRMTPKDQLIVFNLHIPLIEMEDRKEFFKLLREHTNTLSFASHTHTVHHRFFGEEDGWLQERPHHHFNVGAVCGSWWGGELTNLGVPHTMKRDGTPRGYFILTLDGNRYSMRFQGTGMHPDTQMHLWTPHRIDKAELTNSYAWANVFAASPLCRVEARFNDGPWRPMVSRPGHDPFLTEIKRLESEKILPATGRAIAAPIDTDHLYWVPFPRDISPGYHTFEVRWRDLYGQEFRSARVFRVEH